MALNRGPRIFKRLLKPVFPINSGKAGFFCAGGVPTTSIAVFVVFCAPVALDGDLTFPLYCGHHDGTIA